MGDWTNLAEEILYLIGEEYVWEFILYPREVSTGIVAVLIGEKTLVEENLLLIEGDNEWEVILYPIGWTGFDTILYFNGELTFTVEILYLMGEITLWEDILYLIGDWTGI